MQRDLRWLQSADAQDIDRALERGELDHILGQPPRHKPTVTT